MDDVKNVIHMKDWIKSRKKKSDPAETSTTTPSEVVDLNNHREKLLRAERRETKRTILAEFVGAFVVIPKKGLVKVSIYDISEKGIAFDLDIPNGSFQIGEEVSFRVYLNQATYFGFTGRITNCREIREENVNRHGATLSKESLDDKAVFHFIRFIEAVSSRLKKDDGDLVISNTRV